MVKEEQTASVSRINKLEAELERQQRYSRRSNVLLYGMEEDPAESCSAKGNDYAPSRRQQSYAEAAAASPRRCSYSSAEHPERHEQQSEVYHSENEEFETPVVADSQCIDTEVADSEPPPPPPVAAANSPELHGLGRGTPVCSPSEREWGGGSGNREGKGRGRISRSGASSQTRTTRGGYSRCSPVMTRNRLQSATPLSQQSTLDAHMLRAAGTTDRAASTTKKLHVKGSNK
ncbi:hypothetical protein ACOMHN_005161 [Nucella lapillus]